MKMELWGEEIEIVSVIPRAKDTYRCVTIYEKFYEIAPIIGWLVEFNGNCWPLVAGEGDHLRNQTFAIIRPDGTVDEPYNAVHLTLSEFLKSKGIEELT